MSYTFKYQIEIGQLNTNGIECPPSSLSIPMNLTAYRFIFDDPKHEKNHKPPGITQPQRVLTSSDVSTCNLFGLSCYTDKTKAILRYRSLCSSIPKFPEKVGTHLCEGQLDKDDGLITTENADSHIDLFEFPACDLSVKFSIVQKLI